MAVLYVTVCYIRKDGNVLLQLKAAGRFGEGYLNGPGGKVGPGELPREAVLREVHEETGLCLEEVRHHGTMHFIFGVPECKRLIAHVYCCSRFTGRTKSRGEGRLRWYPESNLPFHRMWADNRYWVPVVLAGGKVRGTCWHDAAGHELLYCDFSAQWGTLPGSVTLADQMGVHESIGK